MFQALEVNWLELVMTDMTEDLQIVDDGLSSDVDRASNEAKRFAKLPHPEKTWWYDHLPCTCRYPSFLNLNSVCTAFKICMFTALVDNWECLCCMGFLPIFLFVPSFYSKWKSHQAFRKTAVRKSKPGMKWDSDISEPSNLVPCYFYNWHCRKDVSVRQSTK